MSRKIQFKTGEYYHIYNRGVDKRDIFMNKNDYYRFLRILRVFNQVKPVESLHLFDKRQRIREEAKPLYRGLASDSNQSPLVDIVCYNLLPNHYHFILKQRVNNGISKFMHRLGTGHSYHFNYKYSRSGSLFQGTYKASHISRNEYLLYLSAYINANTQIHGIRKANQWPWSSYSEYLGKFKYDLIKPRIITDQFKSRSDYADFVRQVTDKSSGIKMIKKYIIEK